MSELIDKFLRYVSVETTSDENSKTTPSSKCQLNLAKILRDELENLGASDVYFDEEFGYVYAKIPASIGMETKDSLGFLAHMDTSPECSGKDIKARLVPSYDGKDVILSEGIVLSPNDYPHLLEAKGKTLIVTDGTTLLGADDKAGVSEIMQMAQILLSKEAPKHGEICICFTPDEEIGCGVDNIDLNRFGAKYAYTVDGGKLGEVSYENFNAASAKITINGKSIHPGDAKDKMINAIRVANEFDSLIPNTMRPETTEMYEGFFHLDLMEGTVEKANLEYIIRDHDSKKLDDKKELLLDIQKSVNTKYGEGTVELVIKDQYQNMATVISPNNMHLITNVTRIMEESGIIPIIEPIRGGTDGARLSFMGLPCPNLCTGGANFHGRFEYAVKEDMEKIVGILVKIASND